MAELGAPARFCRFATQRFCGYGWIEGERVHPVAGDIFDSYSVTPDSFSLVEVEFLPPCVPQKIICAGLNYLDHLNESTLVQLPSEPVFFLKPPSALLGHLGEIVIPHGVGRVDYEGELAVIIGRRLRNADVSEAKKGIFGYTCLNDVTARDLQRKDNQWTRAKGFDTFCPLGPWIVKGLDASHLEIETRLNGNAVQNATTSMMLRQPEQLVSIVSRVMTLLPGDVLATGTPAGIGPLTDGDVVEVEIEGIGVLRNYVIAEHAAFSR